MLMNTILFSTLKASNNQEKTYKTRYIKDLQKKE